MVCGGREPEAARVVNGLSRRTIGRKCQPWRMCKQVAGSSTEATACAMQLNPRVCREVT